MSKEQERKIKTCRESRVVQTHRVFPYDLNQHKTLFGGKLMSLIDDTASISATRHSRGVCVTASTDSLDFLHPIHEDHSVCVETYVTGVGKSSIEVFAKVIGEVLLTGERYLAATSFMTFVALPTEESPTIIVPLIEPQTIEERMVCDGYDQRRKKRVSIRQFNEEFAETVTLAVPWMTKGWSEFTD
ncbi:acyl-CoA thioesterase [Carnobacterium gallinarum]|uniref:acyl-CoA thioesterase n=1 Tax=Carnobacterium gallinarum TaxID=2749 RepID=UPI0005533612|nr:acyl-CoA thioesterase [Carnobacterium gallinarum]